MLLALFGIDDGPLNLAVSLLVLFLVVVWLALVYWTYMDARRRIEDPVLVACATAASLFPYVGTLVYVILRPPEFLDDVREQQLETRAAELRVRQLAEQACPSCEYPVERAYLRCPSCHTRLKDPCPSCSQPLDPRWSMCPYCEASVLARGRRAAAQEPAPAPAAAAIAAADGAADRPAREQRPKQRRQSGTTRKAPARQAQSKSRGSGSQDRTKRPAKSRPASRRSASSGDGSAEEQKRPADQPKRPANKQKRPADQQKRPADQQKRPAATS